LDAVALQPDLSIKTLILNWWKTRAYKHKGAEITLYLLFFSGLLLWDWLGLEWQALRFLLFSHMVIGLVIFPLTVVPFWLSHRKLLARTRKPSFIRTGRAIECLLLNCGLSGVYLIFWGVPGDTLGWLMQILHFYSSWLLAPLVFYHALRWSVLNLRRYF